MNKDIKREEQIKEWLHSPDPFIRKITEYFIDIAYESMIAERIKKGEEI